MNIRYLSLNREKFIANLTVNGLGVPPPLKKPPPGPLQKLFTKFASETQVH